MICPCEKKGETSVVDSRPTEDGTAIRRRRLCACGERFTTFERIQYRELMVVKKMEESLLPNLSENIVEDFYLTPDYFEKELNTKYGSGFSIQPKFSQSAYFRFHNKSEIYDGLYFVGAGTHPGAGVPGVLSSAKVLDKIL